MCTSLIYPAGSPTITKKERWERKGYTNETKNILV
jgi:hypothetical protein